MATRTAIPQNTDDSHNGQKGNTATRTAIPKTADDSPDGRPVMYSDGLSRLQDMAPWQVNLMYPPKLEPMPDGITHHTAFIKVVEIIKRALEMMGVRALVLGDINIYYLDEYGRREDVAPDAFVVLGVTYEDTEDYESYFVELMGKGPDFVMEMASRSTARVDLEAKRETYAHIGIPEYWLFDPTGGRYYGFPLKGLRLVDGEYEEMEIEELPNGALRGRSEVLGIDFYWIDNDLRLRDPSTGRWLLTPMELEKARVEAEARAEQEAAARAKAEAELAELREQLRRLRDRS